MTLQKILYVEDNIYFQLSDEYGFLLYFINS
jgi:hypothetical protein